LLRYLKKIFYNSVAELRDNKKTPRQAVPSILVAINICMKRYHL
jgi:hypothetical protein